MKTLRMNQTVYEATEKYPELIHIIAGWGYPQIRNSYLRRLMGSRYTIGEAISQLDLDKSAIIESLKRNGFEIINDPKPKCKH